MAPVIRLRPIGNLANRMLQFMAARRLADLVPGAVVIGVHLPEWGWEPSAQDQVGVSAGAAVIERHDQFDLSILSQRLNSGEYKEVVLQDFLQDLRFYHGPGYYRALFKPSQRDMVDLPTFCDQELIINIRGGEILAGIDHYPLVPVAFYQEIVERTGLLPVLMGQLDESPYLDRLVQAFPNARRIPSQGPARDFQMVRSATNIVLSVSTFSFLAAWLSNARTVHLPLLGFFNPSHVREVNLLPLEEFHWKFYLFPMTYGVPVADMLALHDRRGRNWRGIPSEQIAYINANRPFIRRRAGLQFPVVDSKWYVTEYTDAAMEIAEGWYDDPQHHFEAIGQARGYQPARSRSMLTPLFETWALAGENLALGRPATQSSVGEAPAIRTPEADAAGAVNGSFVERYGFHTQEEDQPWWQVDLEARSVIEAVIVFNRVDHPVIAMRAVPLRILLSADAVTWTVAYETECGLWWAWMEIRCSGVHPIARLPATSACRRCAERFCISSRSRCLVCTATRRSLIVKYREGADRRSSVLRRKQINAGEVGAVAAGVASQESIT